MMKRPLVRTFSFHYRAKFGCTVGKIALDLGERCPNRQRGGCIYCSAPAFSPAYLEGKGSIATQLDRGKQHFLKNRFRRYFAYFQQETSTSLQSDRLLSIVQHVLEDDDCVGLIVSTRPDYIELELLEKLADIITCRGKDCLFELGVQTLHEDGLTLLNRNHGIQDVVKAVQLLQSFDCFDIGAHLIFGIPGETRQDMIVTVQGLSDLGVNALKFHHLQVLRNTQLAQMYNRGEIHLFSQSSYLDFLLELLPLIPESIGVHRLWATAHPEQLIAPRWNVLAAQLSDELFDRMRSGNIRQGMAVSS